ncbi:7591_t:CDS:10 [Ambispora gerdemannii]|uniref:Signal recognition particle subunit SRP68 n=1 Tax=Ambispora gerdemannii TaxID=144530 RepID=A0A9N9A089_9GLOM|nr:7591_t:CDS:10 [Ambispora gerdemannii]
MEVDQETSIHPPMLFSLDILALTNEARNTYGLRHQDYQRYRKYCTQKVHRLRQALHFTHNKSGKAFQKKDVDDDVLTDVRYLQILLFDTERAWSYAMELKTFSRSSGANTRKRLHSIKRFRKAAEYSESLSNLCSAERGKVDTRTTLDAQAYSALMSGYLLFEKQSWQAAFEKFAAARTIYKKLSSAGTSHQEALCQSTIDDIDPNIRYCAFKLRLGTDGTKDVEELVKINLGKNKGAELDLLEAQVESVLSQKRPEKEALLTSITWKNRIVPLRNADLALCILRAQEATLKLEKSDSAGAEESAKMELFDKVLEAYGDAERVAKTAIKEDAAATAKVKSSKSEQNTANLNFIYTFVAYNYLSRRIQRNLMLVDSLKRSFEQHEEQDTGKFISGKHQEIVKLYDNVLQSIVEISELPAVQDNLALSQEIEAKTWYHKASRAFYVGNAYAITNQYVEAIALYERAREYNAQAKSLLAQNSPDAEDVLIITQDDVTQLENLLRGHKCKVHAEWHLAHGGVNNEDDETVGVIQKLSDLGVDDKMEIEPPLIKRLYEYPTNISMNNPHLIDFPPEFTPIPAKPLFFDIASNYIDYPSTLPERAGRKTQSGQSRIGGFLSSFWRR